MLKLIKRPLPTAKINKVAHTANTGIHGGIILLLVTSEPLGWGLLVKVTAVVLVMIETLTTDRTGIAADVLHAPLDEAL